MSVSLKLHLRVLEAKLSFAADLYCKHQRIHTSNYLSNSGITSVFTLGGKMPLKNSHQTTRRVQATYASRMLSTYFFKILANSKHTSTNDRIVGVVFFCKDRFKQYTLLYRDKKTGIDDQYRFFFEPFTTYNA